MASIDIKQKYFEIPVLLEEIVLLYQTVLLEEVQKDSHERCPHPSPSDYLPCSLDALRNTVPFNDYSKKQLEMSDGRLMRCICTNCCSVLLSRLDISKITTLIPRLFYKHPRMPRLAIKEFPISKNMYLSGTINTKNNIIAYLMD